MAGAARAQPDPQAYAQRYATVCAACHGAQGVSNQPLTPSLAGQPAFYAITQLFLFRGGRRDNRVMTALAKDFSDDDLRGFANHMGTLPPQTAAAGSAPDPARRQRGADLAVQRHCLAYHGADQAGGKQVPRLAGQREDYLLLALRGFRSASRVGYTPAMSEALAGMTDAELADGALPG